MIREAKYKFVFWWKAEDFLDVKFQNKLKNKYSPQNNWVTLSVVN